MVSPLILKRATAIAIVAVITIQRPIQKTSNAMDECTKPIQKIKERG